MAQPAASQQLRSLEEELGAALVEQPCEGAMRTVIVHLRAAKEAEVASLLSRLYRAQEAGSWLCEKGNDAVLYIGFHTHLDSEQEEEGYESLVAALGGHPSTSVAADVSGRHDGTTEVRSFVLELLRAFPGVASDDHSDHWWTLSELESDARAQGHPFFDSAGWHDVGR